MDLSGKDGNEHLLTAYFNMEGDAKKGGNNVASMLIDYLHRKGLTDSNNTVKTINFVFNNCAGQNKNKMVLWVLFYIVQMKWALNAQAHFLIHGHTQNTCDQLFNLLKMEWRKHNVYTPKQLELLLEGASNCECVRCGDGFIKDWSKLQDEFWHAPSGETLNNHIFHVNLDDPKSMFVQIYCDAPKKKLTLEKARADTNRLAGMQLMVLPMPGIQDIKWVELYDKFWLLVPIDYHNDWFYFVTPPPMETHKKVKANQKAKDTRTQGHSRTVIG